MQARDFISTGTVYEKVSKASLDVSSDDALLLPSVVIPDSATDISALDITGIERVAIASSIQVEREKTKKLCRMLSIIATLLKDERELASEKIELVRDF